MEREQHTWTPGPRDIEIRVRADPGEYERLNLRVPGFWVFVTGPAVASRCFQGLDTFLFRKLTIA